MKDEMTVATYRHFGIIAKIDMKKNKGQVLPLYHIEVTPHMINLNMVSII
jgi:hypothetical protein